MSNAFGSFLGKWFGRGTTADRAAGSKSSLSDDAVSEVWLYPDSEWLHKQTLLKARKIEQPVFQIGRRLSDAVHYPHDDPPDLLIVENPPYTISRLQCEIVIEADKVILRDLGSRIGTVLGDKRLRKGSRKPSSVVVPKGSHTLVLGYPKGPFRFRLEVR